MGKRTGLVKKLIIALAVVCTVFLFCELAIRIIIDLPAKTDFYSSIGRDKIASLQQKHGLVANAGDAWIHLGWIADPEREHYTIYRIDDGRMFEIGSTEFGSFLLSPCEPGTSHTLRVASRGGGFDHTVTVRTKKESRAPALIPYIATKWRPLFRPRETGNYMNDHAIFKTRDGTWHIIGITAFGEGDYSKELYFAHGSSREFPPRQGMMTERAPVADYGRLAWAPHVIQEDRLYMWFSPHRAYLATGEDGFRWREERERSFLPYHPQFRDPMVLRVAPGQWLMYATARSGYFSRVDVYQSFDLEHWQYIRPALAMRCGAERSGAQASTESPFVFFHEGRYYLSVTYNNDSFFWNPLLLTMRIWLDRTSYNDTLVFSSENPYSFGEYRGRKRPSRLGAVLQAHAPEYVYAHGRWHITTAGWPWIASLTKGEVAVAELGWRRTREQGEKDSRER